MEKAVISVPQHEDEILVRTEACGIGAGDLMPWYLGQRIGAVLGHEIVVRPKKLALR